MSQKIKQATRYVPTKELDDAPSSRHPFWPTFLIVALLSGLATEHWAFSLGALCVGVVGVYRNGKLGMAALFLGVVVGIIGGVIV